MLRKCYAGGGLVGYSFSREGPKVEAVPAEKMFAKDLAASDQIQWEEWKRRPLADRIEELFAHLFSHWL
jgi:hypothetical protein